MAKAADDQPSDEVPGANAESFVRLYSSHELRLRAFSFALIPNWADAEEVLQDTSVVLWRKFDEFRPGTSFFAWAARIIDFQARNFLKKQANHRYQFSEGFYESLAVEAKDLEGELAYREQVLGDCIEKLKPEQREIIRLRYVEDQEVEALAKATDRTVVAIYNLLSRIRKLLHDCMTRQLRKEGLA